MKPICQSGAMKLPDSGLQRLPGTLSPHLEPPSVVGSTEHGKSSDSKGCRHIVGYMIIIYLSMSDIKAYIFASYDISTSPLCTQLDAPTEKQLSLGIGEEVT